MITAEEHQLLTRLGPDTPLGKSVRCYCRPIRNASELTGKTDTTMVQLLGEDLVLWGMIIGASVGTIPVVAGCSVPSSHTVGERYGRPEFPGSRKG